MSTSNPKDETESKQRKPKVSKTQIVDLENNNDKPSKKSVVISEKKNILTQKQQNKAELKYQNKKEVVVVDDESSPSIPSTKSGESTQTAITVTETESKSVNVKRRNEAKVTEVSSNWEKYLKKQKLEENQTNQNKSKSQPAAELTPFAPIQGSFKG